jgi:hypothetical protein
MDDAEAPDDEGPQAQRTRSPWWKRLFGR